MDSNGIGSPPLSDNAHARILASLAKRGRPVPRDLADADTLRSLLHNIANRLETAGTTGLPGARLAADLGLPGTRPLRAVLAYGRVAYRIREIVGLPGNGYFWGPAWPEVYAIAARMADKMGRDFFYLATLYSEGSAETSMAQMFLQFASTAEQRAAAGLGGDVAGDELSDLVDREGVSPGAVLDAILTLMTEHRAIYQTDLDRVAAAHAMTLVDADALQQLQQRMTGMVKDIQALADGPRIADATDAAAGG